MDFHSVMETFAEAWVAANTHTPLTEAAEQNDVHEVFYDVVTNYIENRVPNDVAYIVQEVYEHLYVGLISGSNGLAPSSFPLHSSVPEPVNERHEPANPPAEVYHGRQSPPTDSQTGCTTLSELRSPLKNLSNPHEISKAKSMPVHCIVEQIPGPQACGQYVELDSYAIIPGDTLFNELVRTALVKLGYSDKQILGAKGSIQIRNWKPLAFDQITENPEATLHDILGDLTTVATLHIRLYSVPDNLEEWTDTTVRNAVLELLREMSQSKLAKLCPLSQPMLSNIINNRYMGKIGKEKCQEFGRWYLNYRKQHPEGSAPEIVPCDRPLDGRLTFHPTKELPIMRDWFHGCRNPSRRTLQMYVDTLNQGPVRQQERPKVTLTTLKNWWKNEKQRERKQKSEGPPQDSSKTKRKRKQDNKIDLQREESCDGHLQDLDLTETRSITILNNKPSYIEENHDLQHETHGMRKKHECLIIHGPDKGHPMHHQYIENHTNHIYHKLHSPYMTQNHLMFNGVSESYYSEHEPHKIYANKVSENSDVSSEDANGNHMCSENVIIDV